MSQPKVWLITGCSSGFGLSLARAAIQHGHIVIATSRNPTRTPKFVKEITGSGGHWIELDVTSDHVTEQVNETLKFHGKIDVVVNNAGFAHVSTVEDLDLDAARLQMETNVFGPIKVIQAILPHMRSQKSGTIVNVSSVTGLRAVPTNSPYSASKHAIEAYTESLALEVASFGIRVLLVEPGAFRTNFLGKGGVSFQQYSEAYKGTVVETVFGHFSSADQKQPGEPAKAAERIVEAVNKTGMMAGKKELLRLPLGSDCLKMLREQVSMITESLDEYEDVAKSTDIAQ